MEDTSLLTSNYVGSYRMIITDKATEEEIQGIVKYLNWEASELGTFIMGLVHHVKKMYGKLMMMVHGCLMMRL